MDLLAAWLLFPVALGAVTLGLGLGLDRLSGGRLPGVLLVPAGFVTLLVVARLGVETSTTAPLTLPLVAALTAAGYVAGRSRLPALRPDPWLVLGGVAVLGVYGAAIVLSGTATFAGYTVLPDTAHQLLLAWMLPQHGPDFAALPEGTSTFYSMRAYVETEYPAAAQAALGVTAPLGLLDAAWLYQPFLACLAVAGFLAIAGLATPALGTGRGRAFAAFLAATPALVVAFAMQGSIKELAAAWAIAAATAFVAVAVVERRPARALLPAAVASGAALGALGPAAAAYLAPLALAILVVWGRRSLLGREWRELGLVLGVAVVASLPVLTGLGQALSVNTDLANLEDDLGNLAGPLRPSQVLGVWLNGDYRFGPSATALNTALIAVVALCVAGGVAWAVRRRAWTALALAAISLPATAVLLWRGTPYTDAKVLMLLSPGLLLLAATGALAALEAARARGRPLLAVAAVPALLVLGGVLASSALIYHDVSLAPKDRFAELSDLGDRFASQGPAVLTEYDEMGKYFGRRFPPLSEPESDVEYVRGATGPERRPSAKAPADPDDLDAVWLGEQALVVTRRSPVASRPPASFAPAERRRYYEVWQRRPGVDVLAHATIGETVFQPGDAAPCRTVRRLARQAETAGARLAFTERRALVPFVTGAAPLPDGWRLGGGFPGAVVPTRAGLVGSSVDVPEAGRYEVWVEGSVGRAVSVRLDGERRVGEVRDELGNPGSWLPLGQVDLAAGRHPLDVIVGRGRFAPGTGGDDADLRHVGIVMLQPVADQARKVQTVAPEDWRSLCGRHLDWVEVVRGA